MTYDNSESHKKQGFNFSLEDTQGGEDGIKLTPLP